MQQAIGSTVIIHLEDSEIDNFWLDRLRHRLTES